MPLEKARFGDRKGVKPCWNPCCFYCDDQGRAERGELPAGHSRQQERGGQVRSEKRTFSRPRGRAVRGPFQVTPNANDLMLIELGGTLPRELTGHSLYRI